MRCRAAAARRKPAQKHRDPSLHCRLAAGMGSRLLVLPSLSAAGALRGRPQLMVAADDACRVVSGRRVGLPCRYGPGHRLCGRHGGGSTALLRQGSAPCHRRSAHAVPELVSGDWLDAARHPLARPRVAHGDLCRRHHPRALHDHQHPRGGAHRRCRPDRNGCEFRRQPLARIHPHRVAFAPSRSCSRRFV